MMPSCGRRNISARKSRQKHAVLAVDISFSNPKERSTVML